MAIKKLQNDYTTPEQSKRLLELGVPAESANYYRLWEDGMVWVISEVDKIDWNSKVGDTPTYLPCWSVGRLIEIYTICCPTDVLQEFLDELNCVEGQVYAMVMTFEIANEDKILDFSLLEE